MKKLLAVILAAVIAMSCCLVAFADGDDTTTTTAAAPVVAKECPYCMRTFYNETEYNNHIKICADQIRVGQAGSDTINLTGILDRLIEVFKADAAWWAAVEGIIIRLIDLFENIGSGLVGKEDVAGAVADLEGKVDLLGIGGDILATIKNLINSLKQKIKDFYCHETETCVEETECEAPADTGSASIGIACFAAVSVAAAAAYVCTKKKEN